MCGIIGVFSLTSKDVGPLLLEGLKKLEYRGYDSCGLLTVEQSTFHLLKTIKPPSEFYKDFISLEKLKGFYGIAHNRWATHGEVNLLNAHPHVYSSGGNKVAVVHNGVIENIHELTNILSDSNKAKLKSSTDSELIPALISDFMEKGDSLLKSITKVSELIKGQYAFLMIEHKTQKIYARCNQLPLYFTKSDQYVVVSSDPIAFEDISTSYHKLHNQKTFIFDQHEQNYEDFASIGEFHVRQKEENQVGLGYETFMEREIAQQPLILSHHLNSVLAHIKFDKIIDSIHIIGCGSSYHAASAMATILEKRINISVKSFVASEFRYFPPIITESCLLIVLSQSGETADVLQAIKANGTNYAYKVGICNSPSSSLSSYVDLILPLEASKEVGVASTKAFTASMMVLLSLGLRLYQSKVDQTLAECLDIDYIRVQESLEQFISSDACYEIAEKLSKAHSIMILGRGALYAIAQEGALKIREIAYLPVLALPTSELKHGSLALVDKKSPVIILIPNDHLKEKNAIACEEILARGADVFVIHDESLDMQALNEKCHLLPIPTFSSALDPISFVIPLQMIALHIAKLKGYNVDRPRNLAKSVTVE